MVSFTYTAYDAIGLAELIRSRQVSPAEMLEAAFARLEEVNPQLNAVIRTYETRARQEAQAVQPGEQPFAGVPLLLKDISQALEGEILTSGSRLFSEHRAKRSSNFVTRLQQAGFIVIGHTNTPEFGLKNITEPRLHGPTRNPWNVNHSPGGSSGGAAAAVASGIVPLAGASDGGGSIRIPASFSGLFGLKPTRGRTPVGPGVGRQWQGASIDFALSRSVRDSAHRPRRHSPSRSRRAQKPRRRDRHLPAERHAGSLVAQVSRSRHSVRIWLDARARPREAERRGAAACRVRSC